MQTVESRSEICLEECCATGPHTLEDYAAETPRWCKGCGDHGVLAGVQRVLRSHNAAPEQTVCVSGIGCSSRLPHYLRTYGFHGIHGRALPIATGVRLARRDLNLIVVMGDGDCFSIGGNHWLHAVRYNINALVLVLDNEVYALTKMQVSPTTPDGYRTNTTPKGTYLHPLNPLTAIAGMTNVSFIAQTATWLPSHMDATIEKAWQHRGLSFVRILQRCPVFMPTAFGNGGQEYPVFFLQHNRGIPFETSLLKRGPAQAHDPSDLDGARRVAASVEPAPIGLLYHNPDVPCYEDVRQRRCRYPDANGYRRQLNELLDRYTI